MLNYPNIDPVAIALGPVQIRWYGISYVVGILLSWWLLRLRGTRGGGWTREQVSDLVFYATVGIILGGRLGSVLFYNFPYYIEEPLAVFRVWEGGMSFHGGMLGVMLAVWLYARKTQRGFFAVTDFIVPVGPVGLGSGRIGNFINGELWGAPSDLPWAMIFPDPRAGGIPRHPSQLYEAFLEGLLLFVILWWFSARPRPVMAVSGLFLVLYGIFRTLVEFIREPDRQIGYLAGDWLTMGMVLSMPMVLVGAAMLILSYRSLSIRH
ncbi:MAG: prolipoprotein diacylglyceryl transferase [Gammaproteobacteria bacterium]|nr:MAG: prolipoprotein diacylglyceryl transferase [Gammaproteobacteria bacterium]